MQFRLGLMAVVLSTAMLNACIGHTHYPYKETARSFPQTPANGMFDYRHGTAAVTLGEETRRAGGYTVQALSMPASFTNGQPGDRVTGTYFDSRRAGLKTLVMVLPVWGVSSYPSDRVTEAILRRSGGTMNVLQVDGERRIMDWNGIANAGSYPELVARTADSAKRLKHTVIDLRRLIDWGTARTGIDPDRVAVVGFSIGAVVGSLVVQNDSRVRSAALVMGGTDIAAILRQCPRSKGRTRRDVRRRVGLSLDQYQRTIATLFEGLDPSDNPLPANPRGILMVDAAEDECIPASSRDRWWEVLGRPERITMNYGHRGSMLGMTPLGFYFLRDRIYEHLAAELGTTPGGASPARSAAPLK